MSSARSLVETHTITALEVTSGTYRETANLLRAAGYDNVFTSVDRGVLIDMTGLGLIEACAPER